jgi:multiple sugar transport system substrate-binding protein
MVATAQRFAETHPQTRIDWEIRSLQEFADSSIEMLAKKYDLLVIDHPFSGHAAAEEILAPIDDWIERGFLDEQKAQSVGSSHNSYLYGGHQWALAIDAATPISGWRPDLMERNHAERPTNWQELLVLAERGLVAFPAIPVDSLMHFYMLCTGLGEEPFTSPGEIVMESIGVRALEMLRALSALCDPKCLAMNPIAVWELLANGDSVAYCPFAYGYSNYCRSGYARHTLQVGGLFAIGGGAICRSTLGGAGLAISAQSAHKDTAAEYARYVASETCQKTLYFDSGGQPGNLAAWKSDEVNRRCNQFFTNTLPTLESAYLRPRFFGYIPFQDQAGLIVHNYLRSGGRAKSCFAEISKVYNAQRLAATAPRRTVC